MAKYILKRVLSGILTLFIILTLVFFLMRWVGGSPAHALLDGQDPTPEMIWELEEELGFHDPMIVQYGRYLLQICQGNWGESYFNGKDVFQNMLNRWEPTIMICILAIFVKFIVGIPLGVISATHRNSLLDYGISTATLILQTIPSFWLALIMVYLFAFKMKIFPLQGYTYLEEGNVWLTLVSLTLPVISTVTHSVAGIARQARSAFLGVLKEDYIRTAKAKGLPRFKIYYKHALKNSLTIITNMIANNIAALLGGSVVTERVFGIEGLGKLSLDAINRRDYAQYQACIVAMSAIYIVINILQDIFYRWIDPRIDYTK